MSTPLLKPEAQLNPSMMPEIDYLWPEISPVKAEISSSGPEIKPIMPRISPLKPEISLSYQSALSDQLSCPKINSQL